MDEYMDYQPEELDTPEEETPDAPNRHYITVDDRGRITGGWSELSYPERDPADAVCITEDGGYQFRLTPDGEENPPLHTMDGIPLYRWMDGQVVKRTEEELEADRAAMPALPSAPPSSLDGVQDRLDKLETDKADKASVQAVWDQMAAAYAEGVREA